VKYSAHSPRPGRLSKRSSLHPGTVAANRQAAFPGHQPRAIIHNRADGESPTLDCAIDSIPRGSGTALMDFFPFPPRNQKEMYSRINFTYNGWNCWFHTLQGWGAILSRKSERAVIFTLRDERGAHR